VLKSGGIDRPASRAAAAGGIVRGVHSQPSGGGGQAKEDDGMHMVTPPDFGTEGGKDERMSEGVIPVEEADPEDQNRGLLVEQDNAAHSPGKICERCGAVITASQDARLEPDGNWVHEQCPAPAADAQNAADGQDAKSAQRTEPGQPG
jgi:hypothetical protein